MNYDEKEALDFAYRIKALGFRVFLAEKGTYGYVTDETGSRVMCFSGTIWGGLSGNYVANRGSVSGWKMETQLKDLQTKEDVEKALYALAPLWTGVGHSVKYTTEKSYRNLYQDSSKFREL